jgi:DNA-binding CsgD family transcriptional regulator
MSARALSKLSGELRSSFGFTPAESVVAALLTKGLAYAEIAEKLGISYNTVHTHTNAIHRKAAVPTTGRLTALIHETERMPKRRLPLTVQKAFARPHQFW